MNWKIFRKIGFYIDFVMFFVMLFWIVSSFVGYMPLWNLLVGIFLAVFYGVSSLLLYKWGK